MESNQIKKVFLDWNTIESLCNTLSDQIKDVGLKYDTIVSIGRGGMIPARLIAENLDIHNVEIFNCRSYTDIANQGKMISGPFNYDVLFDKKVLIVDDVYTTGNTLDFVCGRICQTVDEIFITTATMYLNKQQKVIERFPDLWVKEYDANTDWLVFPWEFDGDRK